MKVRKLLELTAEDMQHITAELWMVKRAPEDKVVEASIKQVEAAVRGLCQRAFEIGMAQGSNDKDQAQPKDQNKPSKT